MTSKRPILTALESIDERLIDRLHEQITSREMVRYLKSVSETHAPFQSAARTRGRVIQGLLQEDSILDEDRATCDLNFRNTGNTVLRTGQKPLDKSVWLLAHLDTITYLVEPGPPDRTPLTPICYHLMEPGQWPAVALEYDLESGGYRVEAQGRIEAPADGSAPVFVADRPLELRAGTRICFAAELSWNRDTGAISGNLDDAAGAVALVMAFRFLRQYNVEVLVGLTDEEEGQAGSGHQTFCRGGARLLRWFGQPELAIVSDIHEAVEMYGGKGPTNFAMGGGASFTEKASNGLGEITPPHLYALQRQMASELRSVGIRLNENLGGYVSRTEGINAMMRTPNVALLGFLGANRHFRKGPEQANLNDLVDLAKAVVCYTLLTTTDFWRQVNLA